MEVYQYKQNNTYTLNFSETDYDLSSSQPKQSQKPKSKR